MEKDKKLDTMCKSGSCKGGPNSRPKIVGVTETFETNAPGLNPHTHLGETLGIEVPPGFSQENFLPESLVGIF